MKRDPKSSPRLALLEAILYYRSKSTQCRETHCYQGFVKMQGSF